MKRQGQAAIEFLMTYGWAFLVILVVIGAFMYFDVLNPNRLAPETCSFSIGFDCTNVVAFKDDFVQFTIINKEGNILTDVKAEAIIQYGGEDYVLTTEDEGGIFTQPLLNESFAWKHNRATTFYFDVGKNTNIDFSEGDRVSIEEITLKYTRAGDARERTVSGNINVKVIGETLEPEIVYPKPPETNPIIPSPGPIKR